MKWDVLRTGHSKIDALDKAPLCAIYGCMRYAEFFELSESHVVECDVRYE